MPDASLFEGLDHAGRRRLWLLKVLIQKVEPTAVLNLATQMESFVRGENPAVVVAEVREMVEGASGQSLRSADATCPSGVPDVFAEPKAASAAEPVAEGHGSRLLHGKALQELRMTKITKPKKPELDRATELKMQEVFLSRKPQAAITLDDVVRFLRQRGDVVVHKEDNFVINHRRTMTAAELVAWANAKRVELGLPAFCGVSSMTPGAGQEDVPSIAVPQCSDTLIDGRLARGA
jgi:hypothetical protein